MVKLFNTGSDAKSPVVFIAVVPPKISEEIESTER